jgi:N-acetylglutamate synthase-like GNAT family acetyltransferase
MIDSFKQDDAESCSAMIRGCVKSPDFNQHEARFITSVNRDEDLIRKSREFLLFVYRKKGKVIGICGLDGSEIRGCFIKREEQKHGIGRKLIMHIEKHAMKRGIKKLTLSSAPSAREFWKRLGYHETGKTRKEYQGHGFENILMEKTLK